MNQTTTTPQTPWIVELLNAGLTIYPDQRTIYAHDECELFHVQDLTLDDLARLYQDLKAEIGEALAGEVMQQLTANK